MDKIQKDINDALETARRLSLVKAIFGLSLYSLMVMIGTSLPISLFRMASEAGHDPAIPLTSMVTQLTSVEKGLILPMASLVFYSYFVGVMSLLKEIVLKPIY
ncbi:hypothetical protein [Streptococcus oralis]|uniref:hypothetical protein n=1 Tax=Streptococcus oralis TaxID=1303 RepID=UPI002000B615|nr:hypothetical protein [Streptococcus oralis]